MPSRRAMAVGPSPSWSRSRRTSAVSMLGLRPRHTPRALASAMPSSWRSPRGAGWSRTRQTRRACPGTPCRPRCWCPPAALWPAARGCSPSARARYPAGRAPTGPGGRCGSPPGCRRAARSPAAPAARYGRRGGCRSPSRRGSPGSWPPAAPAAARSGPDPAWTRGRSRRPSPCCTRVQTSEAAPFQNAENNSNAAQKPSQPTVTPGYTSTRL